MKISLNYDLILKKFNDDLVDKLRLHGSEKEYIKLWVPDENFERSFSSLLESLTLEGYTQLELVVKRKILKNSTLENLKKKYSKSIVIKNIKNSYLLILNKINEVRTYDISDKVKKINIKNYNYNYGSYVDENNKILSNFFVNYYMQNLDNSNNDTLKKTKSLIFIIDDKQIKIQFYKEKLINVFCKTDEENYLGAILLFNKIFREKHLHYICSNGISEFIHYLKKIKKVNSLGIVLPFNLGLEVRLIHKICQKLIKNIKLKSFKNNLRKPEKNWYNLELGIKKKICEEFIEDFNKNQNFKHDFLIFEKIEKDLNGFFIRVYIDFQNSNILVNKPNVIRSLEKFLKDKIDNTIQVFYKEKKDLSKIRRL